MESESPAEISRRDILGLAGAVLGCAVEFAKRLPRKGKTLPQHYVILCYSELLQDATACFLLMERPVWGSVHKLMRPIIESYLHLKSIIQDERYINEVISCACNSLEKDVKPHEKKQVSPAFIMNDDEILKCRGAISAYRAMIDPDWKSLETVEQYKSAGMENLYVYSYKQYSRSIHGNFLALLNSHAAGENFQDAVVIKEPGCLDFYTVVGEFIHILEGAALGVISYFGFEPGQETEQFNQVIEVAVRCLSDKLKKVVEPSPC